MQGVDFHEIVAVVQGRVMYPAAMAQAFEIIIIRQESPVPVEQKNHGIGVSAQLYLNGEKFSCAGGKPEIVEIIRVIDNPSVSAFKYQESGVDRVATVVYSWANHLGVLVSVRDGVNVGPGVRVGLSGVVGGVGVLVGAT